jgi:hypothetical protein
LDHHRRQSTNDVIKTSLQSVIDFVEGSRQPQSHPIAKSAAPRRKSATPDENLQVKRAPTEDDLETGCFTDVSFAGRFAHAQPGEESGGGGLDSTDGGCFTEVSFAGRFARPSCEPARRLEESSAVTVSRVQVSKAAAATTHPPPPPTALASVSTGNGKEVIPDSMPPQEDSLIGPIEKNLSHIESHRKDMSVSLYSFLKLILK